MTSALKAKLKLVRSDTLTWYRSSPSVERGFCRVCGGNLFWNSDTEDRIYITAGTLDSPTGLALREHIFVQDKGDYYAILDDLPKLAHWT